MHLNVIPNRLPLSDDGWAKAMMHAAAADGHRVTLSLNSVPGADIYLGWGVKRLGMRQALESGKPTIVMERAYLGDRFKWTAVGLNGLNGFADFRNEDVPDDRWRLHWADKVKPWRDGGGYALIIGQVFGDAALRGVNPYDWAQSQCYMAAKRYGKVFFRPHPLCKRLQNIQGAPTLRGGEADALAGAAVVVSHSSNFGVLAAMEGVPVVTDSDGSMARAVSSHGIDAPLFRGDRNEWGRRIAYAQWTPDELADGSAWRHITRGLA